MPIPPGITKAFSAVKNSMVGRHVGGGLKTADWTQGVFTGVPAKGLLTNPRDVITNIGTTAPLGYFGYQFGKHAVGDPIHEAVTKDPMQEQLNMAKQHLAAKQQALRSKVPKDAVVFGGQPRQDLMEELAMGMAQGQFKDEKNSAQDELMKSLGV